MKEILLKYPIKILQQELINIRTNYRLEKKKITEILKNMKSIKKLSKEKLIDLLIEYNYDINKLPKLEEINKKKLEKKQKLKEEAEKKQKLKEEAEKNLNNYNIIKKPTPDEFLQMKEDYKIGGFKWNLEALQKGLSIEEILNIANIDKTDYEYFNAFFTPDTITEKMLDYSYFYQIYNSYKREKKILNILECSGGVGNIILYLLDSLENPQYLKIDFVEINKDFIDIAKARLNKYKNFIEFHNVSFFDFKPNIKYDYIIGNPPYNIKSNKKTIYDVDFFIKSYDLLDDYGKIVFLMSTSSISLKSPSHKEFKNLLKKETETDDKNELISNNIIYEIKEKFDKKEKGAKAGMTNIQTYLYILEKN